MNQPTSIPSTSADDWSQKIAELLRSMPAELREPTALKGVLLGAVRGMNTPAPAAVEPIAPVAPVAAAPAPDVQPVAPTVSPQEPAAPATGTTASAVTMAVDSPDNPEWVTALRAHPPVRPPVPSLKRLGSTLNLPIRMARELVEQGTFDTQAFRNAYGNGWGVSNREFGRAFADEIARCTEQQIAEGQPWADTTRHALVGLSALSANVLTNGFNTLMDRLSKHTQAKETVSQSIATTLKDVLTALPSGHPAYHEESGMIVKAQMLDTLVRRQQLEMALTADPAVMAQTDTGRAPMHLRHVTR